MLLVSDFRAGMRVGRYVQQKCGFWQGQPAVGFEDPPKTVTFGNASNSANALGGSLYESSRTRVRATCGFRFPWTQARITMSSARIWYQTTYGKRRRSTRRVARYRSGYANGFLPTRSRASFTASRNSAPRPACWVSYQSSIVAKSSSAARRSTTRAFTAGAVRGGP